MRNGREGEAESVNRSGVISAGPTAREMNEWLAANPHSRCSGCQRHTLTASMPSGRCAACEATFEAGVEAAIAALMSNESLAIAARCMPSGSLSVLAEHVRQAVKR